MRFEIDWPEASVAVESRLTVTSTVDEYDVDIELDAFESGDARRRAPLVGARSPATSRERRLTYPTPRSGA